MLFNAYPCEHSTSLLAAQNNALSALRADRALFILMQTLRTRVFEQSQCLDQCDLVVIALAVTITNHDAALEVVGGDQNGVEGLDYRRRHMNDRRRQQRATGPGGRWRRR